MDVTEELITDMSLYAGWHLSGPLQEHTIITLDGNGCYYTRGEDGEREFEP